MFFLPPLFLRFFLPSFFAALTAALAASTALRDRFRAAVAVAAAALASARAACASARMVADVAGTVERGAAFGAAVDWSGYQENRESYWQRQLHLFVHPFYYIEYGIAQLGALQLWLRFKRDPKQALGGYRSALELGGSRPLPELFEAAGARFDFSAETIQPLVDAVQDELATLPA